MFGKIALIQSFEIAIDSFVGICSLANLYL